MSRTKKSAGRLHLVSAKAKIQARTDEIVVRGRYFLSSFYDKDGSWVEVLDKSHKTNSAGWPSSVTYRVLESVGGLGAHPVGHEGICNASNLYERREDASHTARRIPTQEVTP